MNILKELKKAWDNAITTTEEKEAKEKAAETLEQLKTEILSSETKKDPEMPERVTLTAPEKAERMERVDTDEKKLAEQAANSLKEYEKTALENIDQKAADQAEKLKSKEKDAADRREQSIEKIDDAYSEAKRNLENDVLKRGLARSSIAVAKGYELENSRLDSRTRAESEYTAAMDELGRLLDEVESGKINSIAELKETMATRIAEKTAELKKEAEKADAEALKYNNALDEKEAEEESRRLKAQEEIYAKALANYEKQQELDKASGAKSDRQIANMYAANYNKMDSFLSSMNRTDAAKILKDDPFFRANLTEYLYYKLYDKYAR